MTFFVEVEKDPKKSYRTTKVKKQDKANDPF